jgi:hypothetical protein
MPVLLQIVTGVGGSFVEKTKNSKTVCNDTNPAGPLGPNQRDGLLFLAPRERHAIILPRLPERSPQVLGLRGFPHHQIVFLKVEFIREVGLTKKWFQVTRFTASLSAGMHGTELRKQVSRAGSY